MKSLMMCLAVMLTAAGQVQAGMLVTWEDNAGDLVIRWNGNISDWTPQYQFSSTFKALQTNNGMHALGGAVDLSFTGTYHNWYVGPDLYNGVLVGDSFGSSGTSNWVYMPGGYSGQDIAGSLTFAGQGAYVSSFVEGSRDLGLGNDDLIEFRAASVPEPTTIALWGIGALGMGLVVRRKSKHTA